MVNIVLNLALEKRSDEHICLMHVNGRFNFLIGNNLKCDLLWAVGRDLYLKTGTDQYTLYAVMFLF